MDKLIRPIFTFELNYKLLPGILTIGKYDGTHPCLTAATENDKVLIHSPHRKTGAISGRITYSESNKEIAILNINQQIVGLIAGKIVPNEVKDILIIGTHTHLMAYHVHDNKDIFYQECPDGIRTICLGTVTDPSKPVIFVGGNSTVRGYDYTANEVFWIAVGDVVTSIMLLDFNKDGFNEIMVSTEDWNIKVYKDTKVVAESTETGIVTSLLLLSENRFAYALRNGTIGVYDTDVRLWRVKSKHHAVTIFGYDLLGQGSPQLITGWSNGKIDCRSINNGEVLFKDHMNDCIAGVVEADYRSIGKLDLIIFSVDGKVRGYNTTKPPAALYTMEHQQEAITELLNEKQKLLAELKSYEANRKADGGPTFLEEDLIASGIIPANTKLTAIFSNDDANKPYVELILATNNSTIIKAVIIFAEGVFEEGAHTVHPPPSKLSSQLIVPLRLPRDAPADFVIKALVGYPASEKLHVFELIRQIPRFSMYSLLSREPIKLPESFVEFEINERLQRISMWVNQNFLLLSEIEYDGKPMMKLCFKCLHDGGFVVLHFASNGKHKIYTDNIAVASEIIQSLAGFSKLESLKSKAHFPKAEERILKLMKDMEEIQNSRIKLNADVAEKLGQVRALLIKAEDSRINAVTDMVKYYHELTILNKELINGQNIRAKNYEEGVEAMKTVNNIIQKASRLRVGQKSADMLNDSRKAIENNDMEGLIRTIRNGAV